MDDLELDQEDFVALLNGDTTFATVAVLKEAKGDIEADILQALATLNAKAGKIGACVIVLQPVELATDPNTPNPELRVRFSVAVFDQPLINAGADGTGKDVWQLARRVRQLCHRRDFGRGLYVWLSSEDNPQPDPSRRSRVVNFEKLVNEESVTRLGAPLIDPEDGGAAPQNVNLTPPDGASIRYTLDGSYPTEAAGTLYSEPFAIVAACTLRAVAYKAGALPSNVAQAVFT